MTQFSSLYTAYLDEELGTDDSTQLFTTARRKSAVNRGQQEFCRLTDCLQRQTTLVVVGGTSEYDLNSTSVIPDGDFAAWSKEQPQLRYVDAAGLLTIRAGKDDFPRREVEWLNDELPGWQDSTVASTVQQLPSLYYERTDGAKRYLGFYPVPSTGSSATMTCVIPYLARPTPLTSDTQEPFAVGGASRIDLRIYHQGLVHYAAHQLEKLRKDDQAATLQFQKFMGYVTQYLQAQRVKGGQGLGFVKNYFTTARRRG
jgi:hypothetical protein